MSTVRTNAILDSAGGNTATINGIPLRQGILDPENRIINGAFDFWQRGTSFTAFSYGADRWVNAFGGGASTQSRQSFTIGDTLGSNNPTFYLRQSASGQSASTDFCIIRQSIESVRSYAGQTITVLGWARRSSGSGNMAVEFEQYFGNGGSPSANVSGSGQTVSLTGSWAPFAITAAIPSVTGKTTGSNTNDYLNLNFWISGGSTYNSRTNSLGLQTIGVDLWGVHIKLGTHTTAAVDLYKQPELGPELARCQRYYEKSYNVSVNPGTVTDAGVVRTMRASTSAADGTGVRYEVMKRGTPAVSVYSPVTGSSGFVRDISAAADVAASVPSAANGATAFTVELTMTAARPYTFHFAADAEL